MTVPSATYTPTTIRVRTGHSGSPDYNYVYDDAFPAWITAAGVVYIFRPNIVTRYNAARVPERESDGRIEVHVVTGTEVFRPAVMGKRGRVKSPASGGDALLAYIFTCESETEAHQWVSMMKHKFDLAATPCEKGGGESTSQAWKNGHRGWR